MPERPVEPDTVPEVKTTVNLPDALVQALREEAREQGVTVAQYIREATLARLFFDASRRRGKTAKELAEDYKLARQAEPPPRRPSEPQA